MKETVAQNVEFWIGRKLDSENYGKRFSVTWAEVSPQSGDKLAISAKGRGAFDELVAKEWIVDKAEFQHALSEIDQYFKSPDQAAWIKP